MLLSDQNAEDTGLSESSGYYQGKLLLVTAQQRWIAELFVPSTSDWLELV
jgi:hypothetical protein